MVLPSLRTAALALSLSALTSAAAIAAPSASPTLKATLTGAAERPGPGDPKGSGTAVLRVDASKDLVCYELQVKNIGPISMAHIHQAPPEDSGPPLAELTPPGPDGKSAGCVEAGPMMLEGLTSNPAAYYVNLHTKEHPAGALRGQLAKAPGP